MTCPTWAELTAKGVMDEWQEIAGAWMALNPGYTPRAMVGRRDGGVVWLETLEGVDVPGARAVHPPCSLAKHERLYAGALVAVSLGVAFRSWAGLSPMPVPVLPPIVTGR